MNDTTTSAPPSPRGDERDREIEKIVDERFAHHPPPSDRIAAQHVAVRSQMKQAAECVLHLCPAGREQSLAITKLEEAMFWTNAGIARHNSDRHNAEAANTAVADD